ncbi:MAG: hypothetical protein ACR2KK_07350 [Acidimicrobiales bacterium]
MRALWPASEPAQVDYEALRAAALVGVLPASVAAAIFWRCGVAGLIARPVSEAAFVALLHPGRRPAWHPYGDPRLELLADAFELVLAAPGAAVAEEQAQ